MLKNDFIFEIGGSYKTSLSNTNFCLANKVTKSNSLGPPFHLPRNQTILCVDIDYKHKYYKFFYDNKICFIIHDLIHNLINLNLPSGVVINKKTGNPKKYF